MKNTVFKGMATALVTPMTATGVDYDAVSDDTNLSLTVDFSVEDHTTSDATDLADVEDFSNLDITCDNFFDFWSQHTFDS